MMSDFLIIVIGFVSPGSSQQVEAEITIREKITLDTNDLGATIE